MNRARPAAVALLLLIGTSACNSTSDTEQTHRPTTTATTTTVLPATSPLRKRPLPPRVHVRRTPETTLADPAFAALPGAHAEFGRLGGTVYQIEVPKHWNGRLVLFMHGFEEFAAEARPTAPDFRHSLIGHGDAWAASSFSSTSLIPGRAADETAALWDFFVRKHGRPAWTYVTGLSMGGLATHIAAERYGNRFDGALGLCGAAGVTPGLTTTRDFFVAAAYVAGVTQADFDAAPNIEQLIQRRIQPALRNARAHARFEDIMIDLTGGPRLFAREGFHLEEETNWRRAAMVVGAHLVPRRSGPYRLGPNSGVSTADFNRRAIRLPTNDDFLRRFTAGNDLTGNLEIPLLTMHSTGDGQVPMNQAQMLRERVRSAGEQEQLVQRVITDASHCGFTTSEQEAGLAALIRWVEHRQKPHGTNLAVRDLTKLAPTFELLPRPGTPKAARVTGAKQRVNLSGHATLDGAAFDARWLGADVRKNGLVTACGLTLSPVDAGRYTITVVGDAEAKGCGRSGAEIVLWTFVGEKRLFSTHSLPWPARGAATFDAAFSISTPQGTEPPSTEFSGEVYRRDGRRLPPGTRVEAFVGRTRCGVASVKRTSNFSGYILNVVGPSSVAGCRSGARVTLRINGRRAIETAANAPDHGGDLDLTVR